MRDKIFIFFFFFTFVELGYTKKVRSLTDSGCLLLNWQAQNLHWRLCTENFHWRTCTENFTDAHALKIFIKVFIDTCANQKHVACYCLFWLFLTISPVILRFTPRGPTTILGVNLRLGEPWYFLVSITQRANMRNQQEVYVRQHSSWVL